MIHDGSMELAVRKSEKENDDIVKYGELTMRKKITKYFKHLFY